MLLRVFPEPTNQPAVASFVTDREVRVPTDVILPWAVSSCVDERAPIAMLDALMLLRVFPEPTNQPAVTALDTDNDDVSIKGIEKVSKLKIKLVAFDVNPELIMLVVVIEFAE
jgi:hypothetical protein